jgi:homoserine kinase
MAKRTIKAFAPATIANLSCGFDVLSLVMSGIGDTITLHESDAPGMRITHVEGAKLPLDPLKNIVSVVASRIFRDHGVQIGLDIEIIKGLKPGSGLGSSASSGVAAALASNEFLPKPLNIMELIPYAIEGELLVSDAYIADNVAASMLGGVILVRSAKPLHLLELPIIPDLWAVVVRPDRVVETSQARAILPKEVMMSAAVGQSANLGSFVHAMHTGDYQLLGQSLQDQLAEPSRKNLIPEFEPIRHAAMQAGAVGGGISGSGPGIYHLCEGETIAREVEQAIIETCKILGIGYDIYTSAVTNEGAKLIS